MAKLERALIIRKPYLDKILSGRKTWEIRGSRTTKSGPIGLIEKGSGYVVGTCELVEIRGPLSLAEYRRNARKIGVSPTDITELPYRTTFAWVLRRARRFPRPRAYRHRSGAVRWVKVSLRAD